jgi:hypothetical protein
MPLLQDGSVGGKRKDIHNIVNEVLRDSHGFTAREATIVADEIFLLLEENFDAGIEELKKASPLSQRIVYSYFQGELIEYLIRVWWLVWKS